jgi:hypothetical protein
VYSFIKCRQAAYDKWASLLINRHTISSPRMAETVNWFRQC